MLAEGRVFATIAVSDIGHAKEFYGGTLGLQQADENPGGVTYESGGGRLFVYQSPTAGTNQATSAAWGVSDLVGTVEELKSKGIVFEHYDGMPGEWQGDIMVVDDMKAAWFKDPDGNILSVGSA